MSRLVVDASVAVKWVVEESGTEEALSLLERRALSAPDLLMSECANILWKKVRRDELTEEEAGLAGRLLQRAALDVLPTRPLVPRALDLAIALDHAAYDCIYLALAVENGWRFITADERLVRKLAESGNAELAARVLRLGEVGRLSSIS